MMPSVPICFDLARAASTIPTAKRSRPTTAKTVRPAVQRILDELSSPATVGNARGDFVAANPLGRALYAPMIDGPLQPANGARFTFLDPAAQEFFVDWEQTAKDIVAGLRLEAARVPHDRALTDLIGELVTRSDTFRTWWAAQNVRYHQAGIKRLRHPIVGELELSYEVMEFAADRALSVAVFSAEPGSRSQEALDLLASWTATGDAASSDHDIPQR
jgi:MmyB-like transcription regulator ligand binding domain